MTTMPNNAKYSPNDWPIMYFPICSKMNLIGQEMNEIQDFDCRCTKNSIPKWSCAPNTDISQGGKRSQYLVHVITLGCPQSIIKISIQSV